MSVYLDWNATTPPLEDVIEAMTRVQRDAWGNPASVHHVGQKARRVVEEGREVVASALGVASSQVVFTSGGTEANNLAIRSHAAQVDEILCSRLEHPSALRVVEALEREGRSVHWVGIESSGEVRLDEVLEWMESRPLPERALVVLQAVNHETGVIQPVEAVVKAASARGIRVHVDAVQAVGKLEPFWTGAESIAVAGHKFRGPKGIGVLVVQRCGRTQPLLLGGAQESKVRPGTVSAPLVAGLAVAARWALAGPQRYRALSALRDRLETRCVASGGQVNGSGARVPHVTNLSFPGLFGDELTAALDVEGVCASTGSACSSGTAEVSSIVASMHGDDRALSAIRLSLGELTSEADVDAAIDAVERVLMRVRS